MKTIHRKKKIVIFAAAALLLITAITVHYKTEVRSETAENTVQKQTKKKVIGATLASSQASYQYALGTLLVEVAKKDTDCTLDIRYAEWNVEEQEEQMREFIRNKVDAIILCPVDAKSYLNVLKEARNAGIPVINMNMKMDAVSTEYITTYVGASMSEEADLAGQLVVECLNGKKGKVGIIEGTQGTDPQIYRTQTFLEYISSYPDIEVVGIAEANWSKAKAGLAASNLLAQDPDINVFYCHDSNMAMGVYDMLKARGLENKIQIIGIGNEQQHMDAVREGKIYGLVTQPPEYEAEYAWSCAKRAADGEILRLWYKNLVVSLTKENVDSYFSPVLD